MPTACTDLPSQLRNTQPSNSLSSSAPTAWTDLPSQLRDTDISRSSSWSQDTACWAYILVTGAFENFVKEVLYKLTFCLICLTDHTTTLWFKKNVPTLADYNYDPVQSILIIFSKLFVNDHKRCLVVKFSTSPHICCHYTLWNTMLYFALITLLIPRNALTSDHHITSISVKEF